jgi:hypothetical protein
MTGYFLVVGIVAHFAILAAICVALAHLLMPVTERLEAFVGRLVEGRRQ